MKCRCQTRLMTVFNIVDVIPWFADFYGLFLRLTKWEVFLPSFLYLWKFDDHYLVRAPVIYLENLFINNLDVQIEEFLSLIPFPQYKLDRKIKEFCKYFSKREDLFILWWKKYRPNFQGTIKIAVKSNGLVSFNLWYFGVKSNEVLLWLQHPHFYIHLESPTDLIQFDRKFLRSVLLLTNMNLIPEWWLYRCSKKVQVHLYHENK